MNSNQSVESVETMVICKSCDKQIPNSKYRMHDVQCSRINRRCPQCNESVLKSDFDQHVLEAHTAKPIVEAPINQIAFQPQQPVQTQVQVQQAFQPIEDRSAFDEEIKSQPFDEEEANQRLISQLMQEEYGGNNDLNQAQTNQNPYNSQNQGVRQPDIQRQSRLIGGDSDEDVPYYANRQQQQYDNGNTSGGITDGIINAASTLFTSVSNWFGGSTRQNNQPDVAYQAQPNVRPVSSSSTQMFGQQRSEVFQADVDMDLQRALAESIVQQDYRPYGNQNAAIDEDAELQRILELSKNIK